MKHVTEPSRDVPVLYEADVVVAGGGIAGTIATLAAAKHGARTVVIDRFGQLGGNIGPGVWAGGGLLLASDTRGEHYKDALLNRTGMGGVAEEFHKRAIFARPGAEEISRETRRELAESHYNLPGYRLASGAGMGYMLDSQVASYTAVEMMEEAGVQMLLSARVADAIVEGSTVRGVFVETKSGRKAVLGKVVVDATAEADVAFRAGAPMAGGKAPNLGVFFAIKDVDWERYQQFVRDNQDADTEDLEWSHKHLAMQESEADPLPGGHHLLSFIRQAWEAGEFQYVRRVDKCEITVMIKSPCKGILQGRTGTRGEVDFSDAEQVTRMECEHRRQAFEYARFLRKYVPGFEESLLLTIAPYMGARGGRIIDAERPVTRDDVLAARRFDDVIYVYFDERVKVDCDIPYRMLVPKKIDGLLAAGRSCMIYGPNFRSRWSVMLSAQAAGVAAALCTSDGVQPRELDVKKLQRALLDMGCPVAEDERLKDLALA